MSRKPTTNRVMTFMADKKRPYKRPDAVVESYNVERGFAASGAFESLGESGNSYNDSNFT